MSRYTRKKTTQQGGTHRSQSSVRRLVFPSMSFNTPKLSWIHEEYWSDDQKQYFIESRSLFQDSVATPPTALNKRYEPNAARAGRWILCFTHSPDKAYGWAEIQQFNNRFGSSWCFFHFDRQGNHLEEDQNNRTIDAAGLLVTAVFILAGADLAVLCGSDDYSSTLMEKISEFTTQRNIWSFDSPQGLTSPNLRATPAWTIGRADWMQDTNGNRHFETLSYLEKRLSETQRFKQRYRRSMFGMLVPRPPCC